MNGGCWLVNQLNWSKNHNTCHWTFWNLAYLIKRIELVILLPGGEEYHLFIHL